jgi:hypothetical protein
MFKRAKAKFLISDTELCLKGLLGLPPDAQKDYANDILRNIFALIADAERSSDGGKEANKVHLQLAKDRRHKALSAGASDHSHPEWAVAALVEGWMMANGGVAGREAADTITGLIFGWVHETLSDSEFSAAEKSFGLNS